MLHKLGSYIPDFLKPLVPSKVVLIDHSKIMRSLLILCIKTSFTLFYGGRNRSWASTAELCPLEY